MAPIQIDLKLYMSEDVLLEAITEVALDERANTKVQDIQTNLVSLFVRACGYLYLDNLKHQLLANIRTDPFVTRQISIFITLFFGFIFPVILIVV